MSQDSQASDEATTEQADEQTDDATGKPVNFGDRSPAYTTAHLDDDTAHIVPVTRDENTQWFEDIEDDEWPDVVGQIMTHCSFEKESALALSGEDGANRAAVTLDNLCGHCRRGTDDELLRETLELAEEYVEAENEDPDLSMYFGAIRDELEQSDSDSTPDDTPEAEDVEVDTDVGDTEDEDEAVITPPFDPSEYTIEELKDELEAIEERTDLADLYHAEENRADRKGALEAIEARASDIGRAIEDQSDTEDEDDEDGEDDDEEPVEAED